MVISLILMGFNGDFNGILMGFNGDFMDFSGI